MGSPRRDGMFDDGERGWKWMDAGSGTGTDVSTDSGVVTCREI